MLLPKLPKGFENLTLCLLRCFFFLVLLFLKSDGNSACWHEKALLKHLLTDFIQCSKWKFLFYLPELFHFQLLSSLKPISVLIFVSNLDGTSFLKLLFQLWDPSEAQMQSFSNGLVTDLPSKSLKNLDGLILNWLIYPFSLFHFLKIVPWPIADS